MPIVLETELTFAAQTIMLYENNHEIFCFATNFRRRSSLLVFIPSLPLLEPALLRQEMMVGVHDFIHLEYSP